jgi:hypothetical protein
MLVVAAGIPAHGQLNNPFTQVLFDRVRWLPAAVAVRHRGHSHLPVSRQQSPRVPFRDPNQYRRLDRGHLLSLQLVQDHHSLLLSCVQ